MEQRFQNELKLKNEQVTSIKCDFVQTRMVSVLANAVEKDGEFYFQKPNNMLLAFNDGDFIKITEEWFEMKTAGNVTATKVSSNPMLKNLNSILSACVVGDFEKMTKGFSIGFEESSQEWIVTLKPQGGKSAAKISIIEIRFDKNDMSLNLLKMEEKSGDYTAYSFTNKQFNIDIDSQLFNISK
jgi:outer membrane lipoprotein-sorting protein